MTCDEPVLVDNDDHVQHIPECSITPAELRRRRKRAVVAGTTCEQRIHIWQTRLIVYRGQSPRGPVDRQETIVC